MLMMFGAKGFPEFSESDNLFKQVGAIPGAIPTLYEDLRCKLSLEGSIGFTYNTPT
jgi:hypothetical protein